MEQQQQSKHDMRGSVSRGGVSRRKRPCQIDRVGVRLGLVTQHQQTLSGRRSTCLFWRSSGLLTVVQLWKMQQKEHEEHEQQTTSIWVDRNSYLSDKMCEKYSLMREE
jgi:hypothetical protein